MLEKRQEARPVAVRNSSSCSKSITGPTVAVQFSPDQYYAVGNGHAYVIHPAPHPASRNDAGFENKHKCVLGPVSFSLYLIATPSPFVRFTYASSASAHLEWHPYLDSRTRSYMWAASNQPSTEVRDILAELNDHRPRPTYTLRRGARVCVCVLSLIHI